MSSGDQHSQHLANVLERLGSTTIIGLCPCASRIASCCLHHESDHTGNSMTEEPTEQRGTMRIPDNLPPFLQARKRSEMFLELHLEALKATHQQHIEQIQRHHQVDLERRMLQNSLLSTNTNSALKTNEPQDNTSKHGNSSKSRDGIYTFDRPKRSLSNPDLSSKMSLRKDLHQVRDSLQVKEETDWAECQKQFHVTPVPGHVFKSLYDSFVSEQERARQEGRQQRKEFLLAMQKPFSFHNREEQKRDKKKQETGPDKQNENSNHVRGRRPIPKSVTDPSVSEHLKEEEHQRRIRIQTRALETLRASTAPLQSRPARSDEQQRAAHRSRNRMLGFMEQTPSFRPKTNTKVPDFDKLHQSFQKDMMERAEKKEVTLCKPFKLRTSTLQPRQSRSSQEEPVKSTSKTALRRSNSFGGLTSLSMDTLPTYITDATRKRSLAIRKSLELRDSMEKESAEWMNRHHVNSQAMSRALATRAKAMDPHQSLKEVYREKLKQHRLADQERVKDYKKELKEMRARVTVRPYLFEQVSQKNAKCDAERRYRSTLEQAGLKESFVRSKGEDGKSQTSKKKDDDSDGDSHFESSEADGERSGENSPRTEEGSEESVKTSDGEVC